MIYVMDLVGVIPAAGRGIRAYPHTEFLPKCLLEVDGVPILRRNLELMRDELGIERVEPGIHAEGQRPLVVDVSDGESVGHGDLERREVGGQHLVEAVAIQIDQRADGVALDAEAKRHGIRCVAICPGPVSTNFSKAAGFASSTGLGGQTSEECADEAVCGMAAYRPVIVTGWKHKILAVFSARLPKPWAAAIGLRMIQRLRLDRFVQKA
mgnify:CR=1 FL=1